MKPQQRSLRAIISGGGTGGHIFPALAIANALKAANPSNEILFVGAMGRMEMDKVPAAGYRIVGLDIAGFQRKNLLSNIGLPFKIWRSISQAKQIIKQFKPDIAIGVGGYASGPLLYAAGNKKIKTLIQEQNSYAGITNKILSKRAEKICVAYYGMEKFFPSRKIVITGNPVRQDIIDLKVTRQQALNYFGLSENKKTILIIGGSLGARTINESVSSYMNAWANSGYQIIWQTGKTFYSNAESLKNSSSSIHAFIQRMDMAYAAADIVVSRAGASSVSELCIVGKPVIFIPSPNVAEDHQTKNAMALVEKNAALIISDANAKEKLSETVLHFINDEKKCNELSDAIKKLAMPNATADIVKEIYKVVY